MGGAHTARDQAIKSVGDVLEDELKSLSSLSAEQIRKARAERFYAIGRLG
jgi:acetyl-CoA carboxylase carboxyl transferase subunit alpha